jgi:hypothetical protein
MAAALLPTPAFKTVLRMTGTLALMQRGTNLLLAHMCFGINYLDIRMVGFFVLRVCSNAARFFSP